MNETSSVTPLEQIIAIRTEKLEKLRQGGINPYPTTYPATHRIAELQEKYKALAIGESNQDTVAVCGRLVSRREMGKAAFTDLLDVTGKIQLYFKSDAVGADSFKIFKDLVDISDFVGVSGVPFRTRTGELSIMVASWSFLGKALRPLPEKWHGLKDTETRYRQRYLDLLANPEVKDTFVKRSRIISAMRRELESRAFLEVETPVMQSIAGGAAARPFVTHHNALDMKLFMRIAPELYLKRLVSGGMERVYEIGRNFRNEGIDRNHNPEFTMLELYQAYVDYEEMMNICERLIAVAAEAIGSTAVSFPFRRAGLFDLLKEYSGDDCYVAWKEGKLADTAKKHKLSIPEDATPKKLLDLLFDELVMPHLKQPTFVCGYPSVDSPLAKPKPDQRDIAERFELYINGMEIANAYSELNDPHEQRKRFSEQMEAKRKGDAEAQEYDEDYVVALEHGLPPTGGLGIGIDRLVMILACVENMREVILFPLMRPTE